MDQNTNALNWFEIPARDINRAKAFYENILGIEMPTMEMMGMQMAFFPAENGNGKVSGGLCQSDMHNPSTDGAVVYLNANPDLQPVMDKVDGAGGQSVMAKTSLGENGFMAFFIDTEGNKVGLHSMQ